MSDIITGDFVFSGDGFYQGHTVLPFSQKGVTLLRGQNYDTLAPGLPPEKVKELIEKYGNGAGKSRLPDILSGFILGASDRDHYKKMFLPSFRGSFSFKNKKLNEEWVFSLDMKEEKWTITCNGAGVLLKEHTMSACQARLAQELGDLTKNDWKHFVHITGDSIDTLLKGDPKARREYLESFFNIDTWYDQKKTEYAAIKTALEEKVHSLLQDKARLDQVMETLGKMESVELLSQFVETCNEGLRYLKSENRSFLARKQELQTGIGTWNDYYVLCHEAKDLKPLQEAKTERQAAADELASLTEKQRQRLAVQTKAVQLDAFNDLTVPDEPSCAEPKETDLLERQELLGRMREKLKLVERYKKLKAQLPQAPKATVDDLLNRKRTLEDRRAEVKLHIDLVSDGKNCDRCGQSLNHILAGSDPAEKRQQLVAERATLDKEISQIDLDVAAVQKATQVKKDLAAILTEVETFPVFGKGIEEVEKELQGLKDARLAWSSYRTKKESYDKKTAQKDVLMAELQALGYPDILKEDHRIRIGELRTLVQTLEESIEKHTRLQVFTDKVMVLPQRNELETELAEVQSNIDVMDLNIDALNLEIGNYRSNIDLAKSLQKDRADLETKIESLPEQMKELQVIEALVKFFSPAGFKMYELRKRCDALIERSNYWSGVFMQEVYEWSMPKDLKQLEFLVQPIKHRDKEPCAARKLSRGEINRAARVLLFSQLELSPPSLLDILFLDEIESGLDEGGQTVFSEMAIGKLKETFKDKAIIIMSHDKALKTSPDIDHLWIASKKDRVCTLDTYIDYHRKAA